MCAGKRCVVSCDTAHTQFNWRLPGLCRRQTPNFGHEPARPPATVATVEQKRGRHVRVRMNHSRGSQSAKTQHDLPNRPQCEMRHRVKPVDTCKTSESRNRGRDPLNRRYRPRTRQAEVWRSPDINMDARNTPAEFAFAPTALAGRQTKLRNDPGSSRKAHPRFPEGTVRFQGAAFTEYLRNRGDLEVGARIAGIDSTGTRHHCDSVQGETSLAAIKRVNLRIRRTC